MFKIFSFNINSYKQLLIYIGIPLGKNINNKIPATINDKNEIIQLAHQYIEQHDNIFIYTDFI